MLRRHLHQSDVAMHRDVVLTSIDSGIAAGQDMFDRPWSLDCAAVVLVTQQQSDDSHYQELVSDSGAMDAAGIEAVYAIGDAVAPRPISESVFDGHRLAREIDSENPMRPLPYLRERTLL